jgi:nucleoside phosphorylase
MGGQTQLLSTGLGADRTLRTLEEVFERHKPDILIFTGMAGQLDPAVKLGDFVFPRAWRFETGREYSIPEAMVGELGERGWSVGGLGVTVRFPVVKAKQRLRLFESTGARICDMESAAAMMISESYQVPCLAPKIVSDTADSGMLAFYRQFNRNIEELSVRIEQLVEQVRSSWPTHPSHSTV